MDFPKMQFSHEELSSTNAKDQAFPTTDPQYHCPGLTKRELFAAMAMQQMCSTETFAGFDKMVAKAAVKYADALIEELNAD